ncbi:MAG: CPBP family intramembrane glutamic endopeptidase [Bryobacteraceae bacterium]
MLPQTATKPIQARDEARHPRPIRVTEAELDNPGVLTVLKLIYNSIVRLFHDPIGMILGSAFVLIMLWGAHGKLDLLTWLWSGWGGPGSDPATRAHILPGVPWDQEWLSFLAGFVFVVVVPILLIKLVYHQDLRDYGLGLPHRDRWGLALLSAAMLLIFSAPAFYLSTRDPGMRALYPLYRGPFASVGEFAIYEAGYFLFFVAIEFIFRGYLLFGLYNARDREALPGTHGIPGPLLFGYYAILVSMLSYTAWHLGKPIPELWGTLVWGIATSTVVLATRSIWPVVVVHWMLNVFLDAVITWGGAAHGASGAL